jgi:hypothetical protein
VPFRERFVVLRALADQLLDSHRERSVRASNAEVSDSDR